MACMMLVNPRPAAQQIGLPAGGWALMKSVAPWVAERDVTTRRSEFSARAFSSAEPTCSDPRSARLATLARENDRSSPSRAVDGRLACVYTRHPRWITRRGSSAPTCS
jgi:hypothetical protein